jgi:hypothetical protein
VVPTKAADLITTNTRLEVEIRNIHLLETKRAFSIVSFIVAPIRVLDTSQNVGL